MAGWTSIVSHYEQRLAEHGPGPKGVDWPNAPDLEARFATLLTILDGCPASPRPILLDAGCGTGLLLDYLQATGRLDTLNYRGVDLSETMVSTARSRWPGYDFSVRDITSQPLPSASVDVVLMNGVLTERIGNSVEAMQALAQTLIVAAFEAARVGICFNVMSKHVDWERDDLFHWGFDDLAAFLKQSVSRHYAFRADYGLYEYTAFVWKTPQRPAALPNETWWQR